MEQISSNPEKQTTNLTDVTERTRQQLRSLIEQKEPFTTSPPHLYIEAAGREAGYTDYIDNGCRGGWSEHKTRLLDEEPYEISDLSKKYGRLNIDLHRNGTYVGDIGLRAEDLSSVTFYEDSEAIGREQELDRADQFIRESTAAPYRHIRRFPEIFRERYDIIAESREPLEHPISIRTRDDTIVLRHEVESVELLRDGGETLANLHFASGAYTPRPDSGWLPLDHIRFVMKEREPRQVLTSQLFRATLRLLVFYDATPIHKVNHQPPPTKELNNLLNGSIIPIRHYPDKRVPNPHYDQPSFIVGTPTDSGVENIRRVTGPSHSFDSPFIAANRVVGDDSAIWVVDEAADLALPLTEPTLTASKPSYYALHFAEYLRKK